MALAGALLAGAVSLALRDIYTVERLRRAVGPARSFAEAADAALADLPGDVRARTYRNIARLKLTAGEERGSVVPIRLAILKDLSAYPEARDATARYLTELGLG